MPVRRQVCYLRLLLCDLDTLKAIHGSFLGRLGIIPRAIPPGSQRARDTRRRCRACRRRSLAGGKLGRCHANLVVLRRRRARVLNIGNLYGVDIMEEAVEICKLRLFLKLVAQLESYDQIEPLPDIDFNIRPGNTLVGFSVRILPLALTIVILSGRCAVAQTLYEQPVLVVDPGKHTANIHAVATDAAGQFLVTGSDDKTVRIWSSSDGTLLRAIRIPAGPGYSGRIYAVAMSPDGATVAAGGFTQVDLETAIYLFDRSSGTMTARIGALPEATNGLAFSKDGRFLAAILAGVPDAQTMPGYGHGLRVFVRDKNWSEAFRDTTYGDQGHGVDFATDGRLATSSFDGKVRLYDPNFKMIATQDVLSTGHPGRVPFSPNGQALAVGFDDSSTVKILDGHSLESMPGPETLPWGSLFSVAWSQDGQTLFASGRIYDDDTGNFFVLAWDHSAMGESHSFSAKCAPHDDATRGLLTMPTGELLVLKANPCLTMLKPDGNVLWTVSPPGGVKITHLEH